MHLSTLAQQDELEGYGFTFHQIDQLIRVAGEESPVRDLPDGFDDVGLWRDVVQGQRPDPLIDEEEATDVRVVEVELENGSRIEAKFSPDEVDDVLSREAKRLHGIGPSKTEEAVRLIEKDGLSEEDAFEEADVRSPTTKSKIRKRLE